MDKILNRKKELIRRDPMYDKLCKVFHDVIDSGMPGLMDEAPKDHDTLTRVELKPHNRREWELIMDVIKLRGEMVSKWNVYLRFDFPPEQVSIEPLVKDSAIWVRTPRPALHAFGWDSHNPPVFNWSPYPEPFEKADLLGPTIPGLAGAWLPILVNVSRLNKADAKTVKKQLWSVIEGNLQTNATKSPTWESKACSFLYSIRREETFQNYLKWYDIHTQEKVGWRLIAFLEKYRDKRVSCDRWLEKFRTMKWEVGKDSAHAEDRVEKGVKLIWAAIHREPYNSGKVQPVMEEWNCPEHGNQGYSPTCSHCQALYQRFNRAYSMNKGYSKTMPQADIDFLYYQRIGRLPKSRRSSKSDDIGPITLKRFQFPQDPKIK